MSTCISAPYGLKTLLECMSRAVLLAQPDDIAGFLSTHMEEMIRYREKNLMTDIKDNAFDYQEQWERQITFQESLVRLPCHKNKMFLNDEEISPVKKQSLEPPSFDKKDETVEACQMSSPRNPSHPDILSITDEDTSSSMTWSPIPTMYNETDETAEAFDWESWLMVLDKDIVALTAEETSPSTKLNPVTQACDKRDGTIETHQLSPSIPSVQDSVSLTDKERAPSTRPSSVKPPCNKTDETTAKKQVSFLRTRGHKDRVALTNKETSPSTKEITVPPLGNERDEKIKTYKVSSLKIPGYQDNGSFTGKETLPSNLPSPTKSSLPPENGEKSPSMKSPSQSVSSTVEKKFPSPKLSPIAPSPQKKIIRLSTVRSPSQKQAKTSVLWTARTVSPSVPRKASQVSKEGKGEKSLKKQGCGEFICRLNNCPYHNASKEGNSIVRQLSQVTTSTELTVKKTLPAQKSQEELTTVNIKVPYRPKGGYLADPELMPKRSVNRPVINVRNNSESIFNFIRLETAELKPEAVIEGTNCTRKSKLPPQKSPLFSPVCPY